MDFKDIDPDTRLRRIAKLEARVIWHFRADCGKYPVRDYLERNGIPWYGELCAQCASLHKERPRRQ